MNITTNWKFSSLPELNKFISLFYKVKNTFFPECQLDTSISKDKESIIYHAHLIPQKTQLKGVGQINSQEHELGKYDTLSFVKSAESSQKPDRNSFMRKLKSITK